MKVVNFMTDVTGRVSAVNQIAAGLSRLAEGDLEHRIQTEFIPALEPLRVDFNDSLEALEQSMSAVSGNTQAIRAGAGEISIAADDLSRRTEQQASSLEETAAALEQITVTVKKTAEGAQHARDIVSTAKVDADKSGEVVREAMAAMTGIDKSSKQISEIIGVIDEIAFQTNLLALNAGVEAARAGDAGRGFAVVASEVRALAQRSAEAAKEIKGLISASTAQVDQGVRLVGETGEALGRIVAQVVEINAVITDIAASAQEQSTGLEQVNTAVNEMDQVTQKNAAMVEEMTAAAHGLAGETEELGRLVARYRNGRRGRPAARGTEEGGAARFPRGGEDGRSRDPGGRRQARAGPPAGGDEGGRSTRRFRRRGRENGQQRRLEGILNKRMGRAGRATTTCKRAREGARMKDTTSNRSGKVSELIAFNIGEQQFCFVHHRGARNPRLDAGDPAAARARVRARRRQSARGRCCRSSISPSGSAFPRPNRRRATPSSSSRPGSQVAGLLVDGVSDIFTAEGRPIQPTPEIAAETAKLYLRGVIAMEGRLIGVIDIANLLPSPELLAA